MKEKEFEIIIHKHGLEDRFQFTECERVILSSEEYTRLLDKLLKLCSSKDIKLYYKLKKLIDPKASIGGQQVPEVSTGYGVRVPSLAQDASESETLPSGSLPASDALEVKSR